MADEMQQEMGFEQAEESAPEQEQQTEEMQQQTTEEEGQGNGVGGEDLDDDTEDDRKLFVGGISWESTVKDVREYFEKFGKVAACTLKTDYSTQKSRGFGFVCFASPDAVEKVLAIQDQHKLHGRAIDPKKATPRPKKIFVGKLDPETPESDVQEYFSKFGEVEKIDLPYDKTKEKRRAFCFVEFKKMSSFKKCLEEQSHKIKSQEVDVKKATLQQPGGGGMRGGQRGRGGFGPGSRGGRGGGFQGAYGGGQYQNNYYPPGGYYDPNYYDPQYYNDQYYGNGGYYSGGWNGAGYNQGYNNYGSYGYDEWGYGHGGGNQPNYGKAQKRGGGQGYHPYNR